MKIIKFIKGMQEGSWYLLILCFVYNFLNRHNPHFFFKLLISTAVLVLLISIIECISNPVIKDKRFQKRMLVAKENLNWITCKADFKDMLVENPGINLMPGEYCYYCKDATAVHQKNVVVGRTGTGAGMSFRVAKGVSFRTGGGASQNVRGNVNEYYDGILYITNLRMILHSSKYGFDLYISKISSVVYEINGFEVYSGNKCYSVMTNDVENISALIDLMNEHGVFVDEQWYRHNTDIPSGKDKVQEIREFKKLLDDGIITEEEFDAKKKQMLGL